MTRILALLACAALLAWTGAARAQADARPDRVAYHFGDGVEQAWRGLQYIRNHLEAFGLAPSS